MKRFMEFIKEMSPSSSEDILRKIIHDYGSRFKELIDDMIQEVDEPEFLEALKLLSRSISPDQYPVNRSSERHQDVVTRPEADVPSSPD